MITDQNKGILGIEYNHLNLPKKITFANGGIISYFYNALGQKVAKEVSLQTSSTKTDYLGGYQYVSKNGGAFVLQFFPTAEGYVKKTRNYYSYIYNYTDHLGNVRLSYTKDPQIGDVTILEENNYYPFGLKHQVYNSSVLELQFPEEQPMLIIGPKGAPQTLIVPEFVSNTFMGDGSYQIKFQNQERQEEFGLNWDSFKWRNYDYAIGRFMSIDPLTEEYNTWSPYAFSGNRVIDSRELEGLEPYTVTGRAFIPMKTVPNPIAPISNTETFKGDDRNTYDVNATSYRTEQKVTVDFDKKTFNIISNIASESVGYDDNGNITEVSHAGKAGPTPTYYMLNEGNTCVINMQVDASNKLVDLAPSINYYVNIALTLQPDGSIAFIIGGQKDGFPAYEFFLTNEATGESTLMFGSNPVKSGDTPIALFPPMEKIFYEMGILENKGLNEKK